MPNIKSAIKRVSVTEHKTLRNKMVKSATKTAMKKFAANVSAETLVAAPPLWIRPLPRALSPRTLPTARRPAWLAS